VRTPISSLEMKLTNPSATTLAAPTSRRDQYRTPEEQRDQKGLLLDHTIHEAFGLEVAGAPRIRCHRILQIEMCGGEEHNT
jgi:hypothetical protein